MASVHCEILPVAWIGGRVLHLRRAIADLPKGACCPPTWWVESPPGRHPSEVVTQALASELGDGCEPPNAIVHSTSWRYDDSRLSLVLSFVVLFPRLRHPPTGFVLEPAEALGWDPQTGTCDGRAILVSDVLLHGLRHFALLRSCDPTIAAALPDEWHAALARLSPLPAGLLDHHQPHAHPRARGQARLASAAGP
ncbi:MAG: hypothetical protein ACRD0K_27665 [Egibacteraceae bacterium]